MEKLQHAPGSLFRIVITSHFASRAEEQHRPLLLPIEARSQRAGVASPSRTCRKAVASVSRGSRVPAAPKSRQCRAPGAAVSLGFGGGANATVTAPREVALRVPVQALEGTASQAPDAATLVVGTRQVAR